MKMKVQHKLALSGPVSVGLIPFWSCLGGRYQLRFPPLPKLSLQPSVFSLNTLNYII